MNSDRRLHNLYNQQQQNALEELPETSGYVQQGLRLPLVMPEMRCGTPRYKV